MAIDPYFEERLKNWGRRAMQGQPSLHTSSMVGVMEELRLQKGPPPGDRRASSPVRTIDDADADLLDQAYRSQNLSPGVKKMLRLRYCDPRGNEDRWVERSLSISPGGLAIRLEAAVRIFQRIVDGLDNRKIVS